ncbi:MAG: putative acyl-CoA thioesterase [Gemmatimonadetes bacterium]|nr:putative acyl-CoA thioesterase [Gemmatimonadota bacterium]
MRLLGLAVAVVFGALSVSCSGDKSSVSDSALAIKTPDRVEGPAASAATAPATDSRRTVLFLGTSLTAGLGLDPDSAYPQLIQRKIDASSLPYQVVNAGVSGETSAGLLRRLDWVLQRPADVIVVETGANDGLRGIPVSSVRETVSGVLTRIRRARPNATLALVQMEAPTNFGAQYTSAFHEMFGAVAKEQGAVLLPFLLDSVAGYPRLNQADGIHPNSVGEQIVAENVWRGLKPLLAR